MTHRGRSESVVEIARRAARDNLVRHYRDGMRAGIIETLDQLEGRSRVAPEGCYRGPMPDELLTWLADVRKQVEDA